MDNKNQSLEVKPDQDSNKVLPDQYAQNPQVINIISSIENDKPKKPSKSILDLISKRKPLRFSSYSMSLREYNRRVVFERVFLLLLILITGSFIFYFGYYHPIGVGAGFVTMYRDVVNNFKH
jgi:hypothetical protein